VLKKFEEKFLFKKEMDISFANDFIVFNGKYSLNLLHLMKEGWRGQKSKKEKKWIYFFEHIRNFK